MWAQLSAAAIGLWLMLAPWILDYAGALATSDRIAGPWVVTFGVVAASDCLRGLRWALVPFGAWLVAAPLPLDGPLAASVNSAACGLVIAGLAFVPGRRRYRYAGGWSALTKPGGAHVRSQEPDDRDETTQPKDHSNDEH